MRVASRLFVANCIYRVSCVARWYFHLLDLVAPLEWRLIQRLAWAVVLLSLSLAACELASAAEIGAASAGVDRYDLHMRFTPAERAYLASLPKLRLGFVGDWAPFSFVDKLGRPSGISYNYLAYIEHSLHITLQRVPSQTWRQTLDLADFGQVDLVAAFSQGRVMRQPLLVSKAYINYPSVIVTRDNAPAIAGLDDLSGSRVAITVGSDLGWQPSSKLIRVVSVSTAAEGLATVASGASFAYVGNLGVVENLIQSHYAGLLRVAAPTSYSETLHFGVTPRYAPLVPLMDRVLDAIPVEEKAHIQNAWLSTRLRYGVPVRTLWHVLIPITVVTLSFIIILVVIIGYLRREIRQRRWIESELRYQSTFQRMLMDTVPIPIFVKDLGNRYLAVNPAYEQTVGVRAQDLLGKTAIQAAHMVPLDGDHIHEISRRVISTGEPAHGQMQYRTRQGELRDAMYWLRLCYGDDATPRAVLGASIDVTQLRSIERRELALKRQLEELTMVLPAMTFQLRYSRKVGFAPLFVSEYAGTLTGILATQLLSSPQCFIELLAEREQRRLRRVLLWAVCRRVARKLEFPLIRGSDDTIWVRMEVVASRSRDHGHVLSGYMIDVTQSRLQTLSLAQAKRVAEDASQVKDAFLATMSHEIRTPMSGVIGVLELINRAQLRPGEQRLLDMARNAAAALMRILNDVLDFSKNQRGELAMELAPLSIREVIDGVTGLFAPEMHRKGLRFDVMVRSNVALHHIGDAHRLSQILLNLISNALKFTDAGGVSLNVEALDYDGADKMQRLRFRVRDSGVGIAPGDQLHLFTPFVQAASTASRRFGGTGLGLAICKQLADAMGGVISLRSTLGQGTEIIVDLPLPWAAAQASLSARREAWLSMGDEVAREALVEQLMALNVRVLSHRQLPVADARPLLVFRDTKLALPAIERPLVVVDVCRDLVGTDRDLVPDANRLCINPLRWTDVESACQLLDDEEGDSDIVEHLASPDSMQGDGPCSTKRVLLVEDHPLNQELLLRQLTALHVDACEITNHGAEALQALAIRDYPLVITDCAMPVMDGIELIRRIRLRERDGAARSYVVAVTANAMDAQREECLIAGADEVLIKPVSMLDMNVLLQRVWPPAAITQNAMVETPTGIPAAQMPTLILKLKLSFQDDMQRMHDAIERKQWSGAKNAVHRMLGAARWFRLEAIVEAALALERDLGPNQSYQSALQRLSAVMDIFLSTIENGGDC